MTGEARDDYEALSPPDDLGENGADGALGRDRPEILRVRRVRQEQVHAAAGLLGECLKIRRAVVERSLVELEVTGVQDGAPRRVDRDRDAVGDRMRHPEEPHRERPGRDVVAGLHLAELRAIEHAVFLELPLKERERERRPVDRRRELTEEVRHGPDVILVAVGEDHGLELVGALPQVLEVGKDEVDPGELGARERQPAVDDEDAPVELEQGHVAPDLPHPAQEHESWIGARRTVLPRPVGARRHECVGVREGSLPPGPCGSVRVRPVWRGRVEAAAVPPAGRRARVRPWPGSGCSL